MNHDAHTEDTDAPFLIQGSSNPVFRSREANDKKFSCFKCSNTLIDGYFEDSFVAVKIKCHKCGNISCTPALPHGEILPIPIVSLGDVGKYLIGGTVDYNSSVAMTTDEELSKHNALCAPNTSKSPGLSLDEESLAETYSRFAGLSGISVEDRKAQLLRYRNGGASGSVELPFDWAMWKISTCIKSNEINLDDAETNVALGRIHIFQTVLHKWSNHPRFSRIASEFSNSNAYFHTIGQFIIAAYYFENGNRINFAVHDEKNQAKPDLYIRVGADKKFHFEFKSPTSLIWERSKPVEQDGVRKNIRSILKNSSQVNKSRPGAYVLMINHPARKAAELAQAEAAGFFKSKGRHKPFVAGVVSMHCGGIYREPSKSEIRIGMEFSFEHILNDRFEGGDNPLAHKL